jgi:hypothetical protein
MYPFKCIPAASRSTVSMEVVPCDSERLRQRKGHCYRRAVRTRLDVDGGGGDDKATGSGCAEHGAQPRDLWRGRNSGAGKRIEQPQGNLAHGRGHPGWDTSPVHYVRRVGECQQRHPQARRSTGARQVRPGPQFRRRRRLRGGTPPSVAGHHGPADPRGVGQGGRLRTGTAAGGREYLHPLEGQREEPELRPGDQYRGRSGAIWLPGARPERVHDCVHHRRDRDGL